MTGGFPKSDVFPKMPEVFAGLFVWCLMRTRAVWCPSANLHSRTVLNPLAVATDIQGCNWAESPRNTMRSDRLGFKVEKVWDNLPAQPAESITRKGVLPKSGDKQHSEILYETVSIDGA